MFLPGRLLAVSHETHPYLHKASDRLLGELACGDTSLILLSGTVKSRGINPLGKSASSHQGYLKYSTDAEEPA